LALYFLAHGKVVNEDLFSSIGLGLMIGWSIVSQRMQHFVFIVIFSLSQESPINGGAVSLQRSV